MPNNSCHLPGTTRHQALLHHILHTPYIITYALEHQPKYVTPWGTTQATANPFTTMHSITLWGQATQSLRRPLNRTLAQCQNSPYMCCIGLFKMSCWYKKLTWWNRAQFLKSIERESCSSQPSIVHWLSSPIFPCSVVRLFGWLFVRPAMVTPVQISLLVAPHPQTHTFYESLW